MCFPTFAIKLMAKMKQIDDFLVSKGQTQTFLKHIRVAARIARKDPNAVLVFSGGQTQQFAGPYSESQSYWALAASVLHEYDVPDLSFNDDKSDSTQDKNKVSGGRNYGDHLVNRMIVEEYATDSYENLLFSIARFHEYTGNYPELVTVVGLDFKRNGSNAFTDPLSISPPPNSATWALILPSLWSRQRWQQRPSSRRQRL